MTLQLPLGARGPWVRVDKFHPEAAALADRHYSRQSVGDRQFMPPGRTLVLLSVCGRAVWGVVLNLDPVGALRWRCSIFRNEGAGLSSALIIAATEETLSSWVPRPPVPLTTEIDASAVRRKRDPGRCYLRAGWDHSHWTPSGHGRSAKRVLAAPGELARIGVDG